MNETTIVEFPGLDLGPWTLDKYLVKDLFGKISIAWYGAIICFAMILACVIILRNAIKKEGMNGDSFLDYFIFAIPIGVIGARAMYVLARLDKYESFSEMIAIWEGGLAIYGAVIAGAITIFVVAKVKKHSVLAVYDAIIPGLLIAQSIGRWGNFVNGEAHGAEDIGCSLPWAMSVDGGPLVHPTFLYESIITFVGFLLAMFVVYRFKKVNGQVFAFYLVWYGIGRTIVEGLRGDSLWLVEGKLRLAQCIGLASALAGIALFVILSLYGKPRELPAGDAPAEDDGKEEGKKSLPTEQSEKEEEPVKETSEKKDEKPKKQKKEKKAEKEKKAPEEKDEKEETEKAEEASEEKAEEKAEEENDGSKN